MGKRNSAIIYTVFNVLTYLWVIGAVAARVMPVFCLISLLTVPLAFQAVRGAFSYKNDLKVILPAMANNVKVVILTQALLGAGYVIGAVLN